MTSSTPIPARTSRRVRAVGALSLVAALALTGCAAGADAAAPETAAAPASDTAQWPREVTVGERTVELAAAPQRIVALSTETGDLVLELIGAERVVAVAQGSVTEGTGNQLELAQQVPNALATNASPDPEQILALEPDLVIMTGRHDDEQSAAEALAASGVPTATFATADFSSPERVGATLGVLGELLGAEERAAELAGALSTEVETVAGEVAGVESSPSALVLFARGGRLMLMAQNSATTNLVELAGGTSIATEQGWRSAVPADPETIISLDPEVLLVQDFRDQGLAPFQELLDNPALAEVRAVADGRVVLIDAETTSGTAGTRIGEGFRAVAAALHPELAE